MSRGAWGSVIPVSVLTKWNPARLTGGVIHWFGSPNGPSIHSLCDDTMRGIQRSHAEGEFVDIAYNHVVCQHGVAYEGRGFGYQTGANGYQEVNREYFAIACMYGVGDAAPEFTDKVQKTVGALITEWRNRGAGSAIRWHGYFTGSECPGPYIKQWVTSGAYKSDLGGGIPVATDRIDDWVDDWLYWRVIYGGDPDLRPASVPDFASLDAGYRDELWQLASAVSRIAQHFGMSDGEKDWVDWKRNGADPTKRPAVPTTIPTRWWPDLTFVNAEASE